MGWAVPRDAYSCPRSQERNRVSEADEPAQSVFQPNQWPPQLLGWFVPSCPVLVPSLCSGVPQVDSPLPSPHPQPVHLAQVSFVIPAFNSNFTLDLELNQ